MQPYVVHPQNGLVGGEHAHPAAQTETIRRIAIPA
jgi:hypothetical protein